MASSLECLECEAKVVGGGSGLPVGSKSQSLLASPAVRFHLSPGGEGSLKFPVWEGLCDLVSFGLWGDG